MRNVDGQMDAGEEYLFNYITRNSLSGTNSQPNVLSSKLIMNMIVYIPD